MPRFVVHKHKAKKAGLHYDLRIEVGNHLESYAIRKGIPLKTGIKHLAVKQPNHDKSWLDFKGEIKSGYGAGTFEIWDKGTYEVISKSKTARKLKFNGKKMKGTYVLVKIGSDKNSYLFFKSRS